MKQKIKITKIEEIEVNILTIRIKIDLDTDIESPSDGFYNLLQDDNLYIKINIDTGTILNWQKDKTGDLYTKVVDSGSYYLYNGSNLIAKIEQDYVPNKLIPGEYGDYIDLKVDSTGKITNWLKHPSIEQFFNRDED